MTRKVLILYLVAGMPVGEIAKKLNESRATIRRHLREGGVNLRPIGGVYARGRESVCDATKRLGFESFHEFAQVRGLDPLTTQAADLSVSERSLVRVYNAYRGLLRDLKTAGIALPTSQLSGENIERRTATERSS